MFKRHSDHITTAFDQNRILRILKDPEEISYENCFTYIDVQVKFSGPS